MTSTLAGRIETRLFLIVMVGIPWTLMLVPFLPRAATMTRSHVLENALTALAVVAVAGIGWEIIYHGLQQFRWDKDWPSLLGLVAVVPEGFLAWRLLSVADAITGRCVCDTAAVGPFMVHLGTTWLLVWLAMQGPLRVLFPRWRLEGGLIWGRLPRR